MFEKIEQKIKKILEIVKLCPPNLQEKCFEILFIAIIKECDAKLESEVNKKQELQGHIKSEDHAVGNQKQEEIKVSDIHLKAKKLLEQGVTIEDINNIFYKEEEELKPLFDDLKSSKMSESQIKLALLEALRNAIQTGEFKFNVDSIKQQCDTYKCFDSPNFATNFRNQKGLFNEDYKKGVNMTLSSKGKNNLVKIIKELAS